MLRQVRKQLLSGVVGVQYLLERIEFLRNLGDRLVALLSDHLEGGRGRQCQRGAVARDRSDQIPSGVEDLNGMDLAVLLIDNGDRYLSVR